MTSPHEPVADAAQTELALHALDELVRAAHQWSLYGSQHPVAEQACTAAAEALVAAVSERPHITLTVVGAQHAAPLLLEGAELPERPSLRGLHESLRRRQVAALTIHPEVSWDEISALIRVLGTDAAELANAGGACLALQQAGCRHIEIAEVDYSRFVPASQAQWLSAFAGAQMAVSNSVEGLVGACIESAGDRLRIATAGVAPERGVPMPFPVPRPAAAADVEELPLQADIAALHGVAPEDYVAVGLAWLVQASGEAMLECPPRARKEWREAVARHLAELDLSLQARIFRAPRQDGSKGPDMLSALVAERSPEEIADLIVARPAAVVGEPSVSLERVLRRTLTSERKLLAVEPLLRERVMARGMSQDSFRNVVGLLLDQIAADMAMRADGAAEWIGDVAAPAPPPGGSVDDWPDLLRTIAADAVATSRVRVLLTILPYDHDPAHYFDLVGCLEAGAAERAAAGDSAAVLQVLRALAHEVDDSQPTRAPIAASALQRMATEDVAQALREEIAAASPEELPPLLEIAAKMGNECADLLLEQAEKAEDPKLRSLAVRLAADAGERGASEVRQLLAQGSLDRVMAAVTALMEGRDDRFLNHLAAGLWHRQPAVRLHVAECLGRTASLVSEQILIRALYDEDHRVQAKAAESLGEIRARGAVHALALVARKGPLHGRRFEVRKAAVRALGKIGAPEAAPALKEILREHSLLFRERAQELNALAAAALQQIPGAEARQALAGYAAPGQPATPNAPPPAPTARERAREGAGND